MELPKRNTTHQVIDELDVRAVASLIQNPQRGKAVLVVTTPGQTGVPTFDVDRLVHDVEPDAAVFVIPAGPLSFHLTAHLPEGMAVYGGAARVFPPPPFTSEDAPVFLAYDKTEAAAKHHAVVRCALDATRGVQSRRGIYTTETVPSSSAATEPPVVAAQAAAGAGSPAERRTALQQALAANHQLRATIDQLQTLHNDELRKEIAAGNELRTRLAAKTGKPAASKAREKVTVAAQPVLWDAFTNPEDAVRHAILVTWVDRIPAGQKLDSPLPQYTVGEEFAETLKPQEPSIQTKALRCIVDVLTGSQGTRGTHPLRLGMAGNEQPVIREDGAVCMRAYVETNTPAARRLHFWKLQDGSVELSRVVKHDDLTP
ncbi:hypothetical protein [Agromyces humi]|uniref:hypothetical protein n=1 Tax=Agromyces humi TaxID=1766800 RepID=UPI00135A78AB|nr:hypothetical protein [Agromyces humi]